MATESFYQDLVIDTPEKAKVLDEVLEKNEPYQIKHTDIRYNDPEVIRRIKEHYQ